MVGKMGYNTVNRYNTYREIGVKTASQGSLVVMLYQSAVSNLGDAIALVNDDNSINPRDIEKFGKYLQKVTDILSELAASLDMENGGEIAQNLMSLYVFFNKQLLADALSHDKEDMKKIYKMLSDLTESWVQAANSTANTQVNMAAEHPSISING